MSSIFDFLARHRSEISSLTLDHIFLVGVSILLASLIGLPLGVLLTRKPQFTKLVLGSTNIIQTIPSLALFGFLIPAPWLGERADRLAITALTLYALLPIVRNTYVGITGVDAALRETALGMGLTDRQLLFQVELPRLAYRKPGLSALDAIVKVEHGSMDPAHLKHKWVSFHFKTIA